MQNLDGQCQFFLSNNYEDRRPSDGATAYYTYFGCMQAPIIYLNAELLEAQESMPRFSIPTLCYNCNIAAYLASTLTRAHAESLHGGCEHSTVPEVSRVHKPPRPMLYAMRSQWIYVPTVSH